MFSNVKPSFPDFNGQQDLTKEDPTSIQTGPANVMHANDGSSQVNAKVGAQNTHSRKKTPSTISLLQQKFGEFKNSSFVLKNDGIFLESRNGHLYPVPLENMETYQRETLHSLSFTEQGLMNLRNRYDEVHGVPTFLHSFLKMENFSHHLHDMVRNPAMYPYFEDEKFLIMSNMSYDPTDERHISPKAQKLKDQGIASCAWFIHPNSSSINDDSRALLRELSEGSASPKPLIEKLRAQCESGAVDYSKQNVRDEQTIGQLKQNGEYLASILDLNASHVPLLKSLKEKTMRHLAEVYGVNERDDVALHFHFPYAAITVTLHLHIRVNHGSHPFEEGRSVTLDELISGFSAGKTIDKIILEKQNENNGRIYRTVLKNHGKIYENIEGVTINENGPNIYRLEQTKSDVKAIYLRDDLFNIKKPRP